MPMTLHVELAEEDFERVASGEVSVIVGHLGAVEITQAGGLLSDRRRVVGLVELGLYAADLAGVDRDPGLPIRAILAQEVQDASGSARPNGADG